MRTAVTGAAGFLGAAVAERLREAGHSVLGMTRATADITDREAVRRVLTDFGAECVVHCAAIADIGQCERDHDAADAVNVGGTRNVAAACAGLDAVMVFISSDQVYDYTRGEVLDERTPPRPRNHYGRTKVEGEIAVAVASARHYIARIAWQYDCRAGGRGLWGLAEKAIRGEAKLTFVRGSRRSVNYVRDTADAIAAMAAGALPYGLYNVASPNDMTEEETYRLALFSAGGDARLAETALVETLSASVDLRAQPRSLALAGYDMPDVRRGLARCARDKAAGR